MGEIIEWCSDSGIQSIQVIQPPDCYPVQDPADFLDSFDVQLLHTDINQHLPVNKDYSDRFSKLEKYQLKRCRWEGFRSNKEGIEALQEAYQLLVTARGRKRFPVTMSFDNLLDMFEKHPDHYHLFTVRDKKQLIAMAVAIHIHPQLLYIFYLADHSDYLAESPTVMVVDTVMKFALDNGYKQVDLGISSVKGKVNQGLFNFKKNLGCIQGKKKTVLIKP
jgi:lipid II:glycine glycyltransferase (peptidoglycan interpeptide bridge formation enzyme)